MSIPERRPLILGLGGTSRNGSSSERVLRVALESAEKLGARIQVVAGDDMVLPMYNPVALERADKATRLVELFRQADGIVIASPAYHGSISGLLKNAIDYTEDLRGDRRVYWDGCAVGCICCAAGWQAGAQTLTALRSVVHALRGWPTPFGAIVNTSLPIFDEKGALVDESIRGQLELVGSQVVLRHALAADGFERHGGRLKAATDRSLAIWPRIVLRSLSTIFRKRAYRSGRRPCKK